MFKPDDKVRCLTHRSKQFTKDKIYEVKFYPSTHGNVIVKLDDKGSSTNGLLPQFFELVQDVSGLNIPPNYFVTGLSANCSHTWANYIGLTNTFNYCTKCDEKQK